MEEGKTKFSIVFHWEGGFFLTDEHDADTYCFMDLQSEVFAGLRVDCEVRIRMESQT
jgi:hypothetical protein